MTAQEAIDRALEWAEGRLSHTNEFGQMEPDPVRRLEVIAHLDTQEVIRWSALAQGLAALDAAAALADAAEEVRRR